MQWPDRPALWPPTVRDSLWSEMAAETTESDSERPTERGSVGRGSSSSPLPALVLGGGITALGAIRNLGRCGVCVLGAGNPLEGYVRRSRWLSGCGETAVPWHAEALKDHLSALSVDSAVLIPCADDWQLAAATLPADLHDRFPSSGPPPDAVRTLVNKALLADLLERCGVPHPRTIPISSTRDLANAEDEFLDRAFLKPRDSQSFNQRFGVKAMKCKDRADAASRISAVLSQGLGLVLQEYIPGPPSAHCFIDGFIDRRQRVSARFARRRLRMHPPDFGNSTLMVSIPLTEVQEAVADLDRLLADISYRGPFSAEFKQDPRDGLWKLLEVNCRQWWYVGFAASCGVNVTHMAYLDALGFPVPPVADYPIGARCVHPPGDIHACIRLLRKKKLTLWAWFSSTVGAQQPIYSWDDPLPGIVFYSTRPEHAARRRLGI